jgi:hypothetical protein
VEGKAEEVSWEVEGKGESVLKEGEPVVQGVGLGVKGEEQGERAGLPDDQGVGPGEGEEAFRGHRLGWLGSLLYLGKKMINDQEAVTERFRERKCILLRTQKVRLRKPVKTVGGD